MGELCRTPVRRPGKNRTDVRRLARDPRNRTRDQRPRSYRLERDLCGIWSPRWSRMPEPEFPECVVVGSADLCLSSFEIRQ